MSSKLNEVEIQKLSDAIQKLGDDPNVVNPDIERFIVETLKKKRAKIFSNTEAINRILSLPRIKPGEFPMAEGYSDAGYNDIQDPQPGGGYGDYSQFIDRIDPRAIGYNDIQDPQPGGGYTDYSEWIDDRIARGYNDGPMDFRSRELSNIFLRNLSLKEKLQKEGLLSDYLSSMFELKDK